ncbi:hypothetical protein KIH86_01555 [Paenibacillus sp. HN-1]|uniref:hypothetical protein n=1 Tax=Paenibacillus TaxID=44249 RepID=UPI001CA8F491|nr:MULTISPECIES: hypothetical protein [Paenibacillus]MBY9079669.1 hypothetical protein [Paenibacillus sp. CGMCC 1.18879]MBY9082920.1 hypothetical protein [Paenibacillus sinensis]
MSRLERPAVEGLMAAEMRPSPNDRNKLEVYLTGESHLPGPRGNLELAGRLASGFARSGMSEEWWDMLTDWTRLSSGEADTGDPREFLPFCACLAFGAYYSFALPGQRQEIASTLRAAMNDSRWRTREAAAMGLQRVGEADFGLLAALLEQWKGDANLLEQRAFVAALAHPPILKDKEAAVYALELAGKITEDIAEVPGPERRGEPFRVLRKGLEYALSVMAAAEPGAGFELLSRLASLDDPVILRIVKANLGKSRLSRKYGAQTAALLAGIDNKS